MSARELAEILDELGSDQRCIDLINGASQGKASLDRAIAGELPRLASETGTATKAKSVYLSSIGVRGFRGIGPKSSLL